MMYLQIDNEPNLGYEWFCKVPSDSPLPYTEIAAEYAAFFAATASAIHAIGDPRLRVGAAPMAPGGIV